MELLGVLLHVTDDDLKGLASGHTVWSADGPTTGSAGQNFSKAQDGVHVTDTHALRHPATGIAIGQCRLAVLEHGIPGAQVLLSERGCCGGYGEGRDLHRQSHAPRLPT